MKKAIIYSESSHAVEVFSQILSAEGFDTIEAMEDVAFCGVHADAALHLVNAGESFEAAVKLAEKLSTSTSAAVMLLADTESLTGRAASLRENGVIVVEKPLSRHLFVQSVQDAAPLQGRIRRMGIQLEETRKICRAKLLLVEKRHMTEQEAHKHIEREAMNRRITRLELADEIIKTYM